MDPRWYSPGALRQVTRHLWALLPLLALVACSGPRSRPTAPCMSDTECRGDRICHEGKCRFVEEVLAELSLPPEPGFNCKFFTQDEKDHLPDDPEPGEPCPVNAACQ